MGNGRKSDVLEVRQRTVRLGVGVDVAAQILGADDEGIGLVGGQAADGGAVAADHRGAWQKAQWVLGDRAAIDPIGDRPTARIHSIGPGDIESMRAAGLKDGEILEINQVTAYFAYANRTVTGLGVETEGEVLGLAPDESEDWHHG